MIPRLLELQIKSALKTFPVVAIIGPRQVGKSTLAKALLGEEAVYLDLEDPQDLRVLDHAPSYFEQNANRLICIDEIQRKPELFPLLRSFIDKHQRKPRFIILGSAAPDLLRQSSESLAGRIKYHELKPFTALEVSDGSMLRLRGGYPLSYLAGSDEESFSWRKELIKSYIERDLPGLGFRRSSSLIHKVWTMLAHYHGQVLNKAKIGQSADISGEGLSGYIDMLVDTFMLRILPPHFANTKKRLVKSPKVYIRDPGLLNSLLNIGTTDDLFRHPSFGNNWEGYCIESILSVAETDFTSSYFRTARGEEFDLVLERGGETFAFEFKSSSAPQLTDKNRAALEILQPNQSYLIAPVEKEYTLPCATMVRSLETVLTQTFS